MAAGARREHGSGTSGGVEGRTTPHFYRSSVFTQGPRPANGIECRHVSRRAETGQRRAVQDGRRARRGHPERRRGHALADLPPGHLQVDLGDAASPVQGDHLRARPPDQRCRRSSARPGPSSTIRPTSWPAPTIRSLRPATTSRAATMIEPAVAPAARAQRDGRAADPGTAARRARARVRHGRLREATARVSRLVVPASAPAPSPSSPMVVARRQLAESGDAPRPREPEASRRSAVRQRCPARRVNRRAEPPCRSRCRPLPSSRAARAAPGGPGPKAAQPRSQDTETRGVERAGAALERGARRGARAAGERHPRGAAEPAVLGGPAHPGRRRHRDPHEPGRRGELRPGLPPAAGGDRSRVPGLVHGGGEDAGLDAGGGARVVRAGRAQGGAGPGRADLVAARRGSTACSGCWTRRRAPTR